MKTRAVQIFLAALLATAPALAAEDDAAMLELADKSRCTICHDVREKITGPAWIDVAKRYRDDAGALERLVVKVREGGAGAWGSVPMSPNKRVPEENIRKLVTWILSLK